MGEVFVFTGKPSHASIKPWQRKSALDAVILMFNGLDAPREHSGPWTRMHGVITDGATPLVARWRPGYAASRQPGKQAT